MLYSYRHPDIVAGVAARELLPELSPHELAGLLERRRFIRPIPIAAVTHGSDVDAWFLWDEAVESEAAQAPNETAT
jgi:hypothetical protein